MIRCTAMTRSISTISLAVLLASWTGASRAGEANDPEAARRGYDLLTSKPYLPPDFDDAVFENLWKAWPAELREQARDATPAERRRMAFSRYGLIERPGSDGTGTALGYTSDGQGGWVMNCLACHSGKVAGQPILGAPNTNYALATLTEDVAAIKLQMRKPLGHMELGSVKIPLGTTRGTTNSVMFGVALGALRDADLNFRPDLPAQRMVHHDMDAPPFWNVRRKKQLYCDGFVAKTHRPLIQFVMIPKNSGETLRNWEPDYQDILSWIEAVDVPQYSWEIDRPLAAQGRAAFERVCSRCHGTYGDNPTYLERLVRLDEIQTDPVRAGSLTHDYRKHMQDGWLGDYGKQEYRLDPNGYVAPPLNGIWATAPYLHNGSVPTLWHVLHPDQRPTVWRRTEDGYDRARVGLEIEPFDAVPAQVRSNADRREFFDTRRPGKSAAGHLFPDELSEAEKQAVLEYLKTL